MSTKTTLYPYPPKRTLLDEVAVTRNPYAQSPSFERVYKKRTVKARRQNDRRVVARELEAAF